jgi:CRP/FNR family transcriptional regulator
MNHPSDHWTRRAGLGELPLWAERELEALTMSHIPRGTVFIHPGQSALSFVMVLSGRIDVFLTGPMGREILLCSVEPGESCVQTTLGLLGAEDYVGEDVAGEDAEVVAIPRGLFLRLMNEAPSFRAFVFHAFGTRIQDMLHLLERFAFQRVESRLAAELLALD